MFNTDRGSTVFHLYMYTSYFSFLNMSESLFTSVKTTDDVDDEEKLTGDGGPTATSFRDDRGRRREKKSDVHEIDFENAGEFSPVSLHDDDDESDDDIRRRAKKLIDQRLDDDVEDRIFVGGGWGRHGSQFSFCPKGFCACCGGDPATSRAPSANKCALLRTLCALVAFVLLVMGAGLFGYEAGLPASAAGEYEGKGAVTGFERGEVVDTIHYHGTRGEEWIQWLEREKDEIHLPHWNFTVRSRSHPSFKAPFFAPLDQPQLLRLSENVFQSCTERSLRTQAGHKACLSFCHGHYCCFERDPAFGSCVGELNSYCFAYAACENVLGDFEMNNVALGRPDGDTLEANNEPLNAQDAALLEETCSEASVATPEGKRDCSAFCQHNLCCFDEWGGESCYDEHPGYCEAYASCFILIDVSERIDVLEEVVGVVDKENGNGDNNSDGTPIFAGGSDANANDVIETAVKAVCGLRDESRNDGSWVAACHALCSDHLCCFSVDGTPGNCRETYGEDLCNAYQDCQVLGNP